MRALMPLSGFPSPRKEMDRFFDRFGDWESPELRALGEGTPSLDLSETKDAFVVKAEIPGIEPKEIQVSLESQVLTIKGEKKQEKEEKDEQYYRAERGYGAVRGGLRP